MVGQLGVSGEMLDRAADAITKQLDGGYRTHWCAEWENEAGRCGQAGKCPVGNINVLAVRGCGSASVHDNRSPQTVRLAGKG